MGLSGKNFKIFSLVVILVSTLSANAQESTSVPEGEEKPSNLQKFLQFEEKLKTAVCDESVLNRAPNLEGLGKSATRKPNLFWVQLDKDFSEKRLLAFILGDALSGAYANYLDGIIQETATEKQESNFLERQSKIASLKRKATLEICQALVQPSLWQSLLDTKPSRFLQAWPAVSEQDKEEHRRAAKGFSEKGPFLQVQDSESRFGFDVDASVYLVPGWVEPFELDRAFSQSRVYRRFSNPLTNQTQSIQVLSSSAVPLGLLFVTAEEASMAWEALVAEAKKSRAQEIQVETYRMMIENDAVQALQRNPKHADEVRKLQEFYKKLLQAYLIFPDEKQFESFGRQEGPGFTFSEVHEKYLTDGFLKSLASVRVNGGYVKLGLFRPDSRLHSIYLEYKKKLSRF
jgi:hypothetical protein